MRRVLWVLKEGTPGHTNQALGVAEALKERADVVVKTLDVPLHQGLRRFKMMHRAKKGFPSPEAAKAWLAAYEGAELVESVTSALREGDSLLFMSAGSSAAPYTLALAKAFGAKSCVVMTPSVLGVAPFDFALVPAHDKVDGPNVMVTLGAPNGITRAALEHDSRALTGEFPPKRDKAWAVAFGGDDAYYKMTASWMARACKALLKRAESEKATLYITTSRRTSPEAEAELVSHMEGNPNVSMLMLASQDRRNPVPGMMGCCDVAFTTQDSVNMISECATAGLPLVVLEVPLKRSPQARLRALLGPNRMAKNLELFLARGLAAAALPEDLAKMDLSPKALRPRGDVEFNEARRAADWILKGWPHGGA